MKAALLNGILGTVLSVMAGTQLLNLNLENIIVSLFASNFAALIALLLSLHSEKLTWFRRLKINSTVKVWSTLIISYLTVLLGFSPTIREPSILIVMILPLVLSTGFSILVFGPIQDQIVRRQQKREQIYNSEARQTTT